MIGQFTYDQILEFSKLLAENAEVINKLAKKHDAGMLETFIANVERYSTFLKSTVEMYKDVDEVLKNFKQ